MPSESLKKGRIRLVHSQELIVQQNRRRGVCDFGRHGSTPRAGGKAFARVTVQFLLLSMIRKTAIRAATTAAAAQATIVVVSLPPEPSEGCGTGMGT